MVGAEVDFYVQGMEGQPKKIVDMIFDYYQERYDDKKYTTFARYTKSSTNVTTQPWFNREIFIKLFKKNEGRDLDNRHPFPYVSIQVRYDRDDQRIVYTWEQAFHGYLRWQ